MIRRGVRPRRTTTNSLGRQLVRKSDRGRPHAPGHIDAANEVIVGLQTDRPFRRAIMPAGGLSMVEVGAKAAGFEPDVRMHEIFAKYRRTHNNGVFDAYTPEIRACRKSGVTTGLPDA